MEHRVRLGSRQRWGGWQPLWLSCADRRRHLYVIGQTGTGKSTLLRQILTQDIRAREGCALIDPHGDLALELLERIPSWRTDDVVYLDPSDRAHVVGLNPFFRVPRDERPLVAANIVSTLKKIWSDSWGPRLEYILGHSVRALLDVRSKQLRPTLLALPRLYIDRAYRAAVVAEIEDTQTRLFFSEEFGRWNERQLAEALSPVQNKVGQLLANPFIRNVFGSWKPSVELGELLEAGKILVVRVPKGSLGEEPANLLGSLVVGGLLQGAMRRADRPPAERPDFHLVIDEFQNFTTDAFASVLSEARKYGLTLALGHQYVEQLSEPVRAAIFGNVGTLLTLRVSAGDAERLAREIGEYPPNAFRDLARGELIGRVLEHGEPSPAFLGRTELMDEPLPGRGEGIRAQCRQRYARPRAIVEAQVRRWLKT